MRARVDGSSGRASGGRSAAREAGVRRGTRAGLGIAKRGKRAETRERGGRERYGAHVRTCRPTRAFSHISRRGKQVSLIVTRRTG